MTKSSIPARRSSIPAHSPENPAPTTIADSSAMVARLARQLKAGQLVRLRSRGQLMHRGVDLVELPQSAIDPTIELDIEHRARGALGDQADQQIGRASCRERV